MQTCSLFNLHFNALSLVEAVDFILTRARKRKKGLVVTPNADHIVLMRSDALMRKIYSAALAVFADGMPLVFLSRLIGDSKLPERVTGSDLLPAICQRSAGSGESLFLLGGNPGAAESAARRLTKAHPGLRIVGCYCPPFGFEQDERETEKIIEFVNRCKPDILVLGLGTPKQEKWAFQNIEKLQVGPILCIGAAIDFAAGGVKRCPKQLQRAGMEWAWRLCSQPRRLWKRYLLRGPVFMKLAALECFRARFGPGAPPVSSTSQL